MSVLVQEPHTNWDALIRPTTVQTFDSLRYSTENDSDCVSRLPGLNKEERVPTFIQCKSCGRFSFDVRTKACTTPGCIFAQKPELARPVVADKPESPSAELTDREMVETLSALCDAYIANRQTEIDRLEPLASAIGRVLDRRGGIGEMRRLFRELQGRRGSRTLEMHWNGIGDWRG